MKYNIIYIDPPWDYDRKVGHGCDTKYNRMSNEDIYNLPINDIADKNCALLCWMTFPKLAEGIKAIESWGFTIKTVFVTWVKTNKHKDTPFFGVGTYTKSNAEICMLCEKGEIPKLLPPRRSIVGADYIGKVRDDSISSILLHKRLEHSEKPNEVRSMISRMFLDLPKIEIFARHKIVGFDSIGYGVDGLDIKESLDLIKNDKYKADLYIQPLDDI